jgi:hypothetical protein
MVKELYQDHWLETYKSLISISVEGFKFSALANGGAAVAILAYLGNVAGKGAAVPSMQIPMLAFLVGLVFVGLSMLFAYFTQLKLLLEIGASEPPRPLHDWLLWFAVILFFCSLVAFACGSWLAVVRFG